MGSMWVRVDDFRDELIAAYGAPKNVFVYVPPDEEGIYISFDDNEHLLNLLDWLEDVGASYETLQGRPPGP